MGGKWPELFKQIAPAVTRAVVIRDPTFAAGIGQFAVIQAVALLRGRGQPWLHDAANLAK
jgi:hypothetical protein